MSKPVYVGVIYGVRTEISRIEFTSQIQITRVINGFTHTYTRTTHYCEISHSYKFYLLGVHYSLSDFGLDYK